MNEVERILSAIEEGDSQTAEKLLPLVYDELRKLADQKLPHGASGQTLDATAQVHDAYLRLVRHDDTKFWNDRRNFFGAANEAIRRILIDKARWIARGKQSGDRRRTQLATTEVTAPKFSDDLLALDEALQRLTKHEPQAAELVKLRFFSELTILQSAEILGISPHTANSLWSFAGAWLHHEIKSV